MIMDFSNSKVEIEQVFIGAHMVRFFGFVESCEQTLKTIQ